MLVLIFGIEIATLKLMNIQFEPGPQHTPISLWVAEFVTASVGHLWLQVAY